MPVAGGCPASWTAFLCLQLQNPTFRATSGAWQNSGSATWEENGSHGRLCERASADEISIEALAELVELSSSHFAHVFKETTGMTPLQFIPRQRITRTQQSIRETSRSLIDVGLEVGYTSPSDFAQVFRRVVGVTATEFRSSL